MWRRDLLILAGLVVATVLFRLPVLTNARDVNSDAALVGLQAMHMLRGEWSWLLWGIGYQSSIDSMISAGAFAIFGASPRVLMAVPIVLHAVIVLLTFLILRKRIDPWLATVCTLPLVFAPVALTWPIVSANRQACIAIFFVSIWLIDGAAESKWPLLRLPLGALMVSILPLVDLFAVLLVPGALSLLVMSIFDGTHEKRLWMYRALACGVAISIGACAFLMSRSNGDATTGQAGLTLARVSSNGALLMDTCLPYSLGAKHYRDGDIRYRGTVAPPPMPWAALTSVAGWSLLLAVVAAGGLSFSKFPWPLRRLGLFGFITTISTLAAFLFSVMPADLWSVRYLGPIFWTAPLALAPLANFLGRRTFTLAIVPWLIVSSISGWRSYQSPFTADGLAEEQQLIEHLKANHIRYAAADYWLAYRLTFVSGEAAIVVPLEPMEDRYGPYRQAFLAEPQTALIFHPRWSRIPQEKYEQSLQSLQELHISYTTTHVGKFTILLTRRAL
jgi:hypothetical protein